jgi:hypothetical protein
MAGLDVILKPQDNWKKYSKSHDETIPFVVKGVGISSLFQELFHLMIPALVFSRQPFVFPHQPAALSSIYNKEVAMKK